MTSKYGFSVVAPISVIRPSSTAGSSASCCALLKRWISSRKRIVRCAGAAEPVARAREHRAHVGDRRRDRRQLLEGGAGRLGDDPRERRLAGARRPVEDHRARRGPPRSPAAAPSPRRARARWPTNSSSVRGRSRSASGATSGSRSRGRVGEEVAHAAKYAPATWRRRDRGLLRADPPGRGRAATTSATCAPTSCSRSRRRPEEMVHRDELLFQTVHQSSELWLKLAWNEVEEATRLLARRRARAGDPAAAPRGRLPRERDRAARHARAHVAVGVPGDPSRARPRQRLRLARLPRDPPRHARARRGLPQAAPRRRGCRSSSSTSAAASSRSSTSSPSC